MATFQLVMRSGPSAGMVYPLEKPEVFIGRDLGNDVVINDPEVSRRHARLFVQGATYVLEDLGSTNGILVNGQRLSGPYQLNSGETVTLGETINLVFEAVGGTPDMDATMVAGAGGDQTVPASGMAQPAYQPVQPPAPDPFAMQPPPQDPFAQDPYAQPDPYAQQPPPPDPYGGQQPMEPAYAGQVPEQPSAYAIEQEGGKRKFPIVLLLVIIVVVVVCVCGVGLYLIDANNMWCDLLGFVFNMISPGTCSP